MYVQNTVKRPDSYHHQVKDMADGGGLALPGRARAARAGRALEVLDAHDVPMPQTAQQSGLVARTLHNLFVFGPSTVQQLDGYNARKI